MRSKMSANSGSGIATSASGKVTYRPCRTTLAPILTSFSRSVDRDYFTCVVGYERTFWGPLIFVRFTPESRHTETQCPLLGL